MGESVLFILCPMSLPTIASCTGLRGFTAGLEYCNGYDGKAHHAKAPDLLMDNCLPSREQQISLGREAACLPPLKQQIGSQLVSWCELTLLH